VGQHVPDRLGQPAADVDGGDLAPALATATSAYTDSGLTNGTAYSYYVTAVDSSTPANASAPSTTVSATPSPPPPAPTVKSYNPAGYLTAAGSVYGSTGAVSRLYTNNGVRVEINAASGSPRVANLQPFAYITAVEQASLSKLTVNFDAGVSSSSASISFLVCRWNGADCIWELVASYGTGTTADRSFTWTTTSPTAYVSASGEVRVAIRGSRSSSSSFRARADWVRFTIEH
jgi:hypothetical protein